MIVDNNLKTHIRSAIKDVEDAHFIKDIASIKKALWLQNLLLN